MIIIQHWHHMKHIALWELDILHQHSIKIQGNIFMSLLSTNLHNCYIQHLWGTLEFVFDLMPTSCPTVIIGDFNVNMLQQNSTQSNDLDSFMHYYSTKFQFIWITINYGSHVDHIWTNVSSHQYMSRVVDAYPTDHKPKYFEFKIPYNV